MKKWMYIYITITCLTLSLNISATLNKIAIVNISEIFQQSAQRAIIAKQLEEEFKDRALELQSIEQNLQKKIQKLQRDGSIMRITERNDLEQSIIAERDNFSNKAKEFQQDNQSRQTEERNKILNMIQKIVKTISIKNDYDLVIDSNVIAYASNIHDITDDVLKQVK